MNVNVKTTPRQEFFLKQMAALQFEGSQDNFGTANPIHILQELDPRWSETSLSEIDGYINAGDYKFRKEGCDHASLEEVVKEELGLSEAGDEEIAQFNQRALEGGEIPFVPFKEAYQNGIPNYNESIFAADDYLEAYDVYVEGITAFVLEECVWENRAFAFTHKEARRFAKYNDNHLFEETRTYADASCNVGYNYGDFVPLWNFLRDAGQALLDEESKELMFSDWSAMEPEAVKDFLAKRPGEEFVAAACTGKAPGTLFGAGSAVCNFQITVTAKGEMKTSHLSDTDYPVLKPSVKLNVWGEKAAFEFKHKYPFSYGSLFEELNKESGFLRLANYLRYWKLSPPDMGGREQNVDMPDKEG